LNHLQSIVKGQEKSDFDLTARNEAVFIVSNLVSYGFVFLTGSSCTL